MPEGAGVRRSGTIQVRSPGTVRVRRVGSNRVKGRGWILVQAPRSSRARWSRAIRSRARPSGRVGGDRTVQLPRRPAERLGRCRWGARSRLPRSLRRPPANRNPRRRRGARRPPSRGRWVLSAGPTRPGTAASTTRAHRRLVRRQTGGRPRGPRHRASANGNSGRSRSLRPNGPARQSSCSRSLRPGGPARAARSSPPTPGRPAPPHSPAAPPGGPARRPEGPPPGRAEPPAASPSAPPPVQMDPTPAEWSDQRPRPWLPPTLRRAYRLAVGSRRWNRPPGLRGGWRGSRDSMSTVQGVRMSRRVAPDGRPWMPGGWTLRWTPPSTGRRARRRRFGPGRWARRHPGRVSGPPLTRAVASGPRPPTRRPRDPADGPRASQAVGRHAAIWTRRRRRDPGSVPPALRRPKRWRPSWTRRPRGRVGVPAGPPGAESARGYLDPAPVPAPPRPGPPPLPPPGRRPLERPEIVDAPRPAGRPGEGRRRAQPAADRAVVATSHEAAVPSKGRRRVGLVALVLAVALVSGLAGGVAGVVASRNPDLLGGTTATGRRGARRRPGTRRRVRRRRRGTSCSRCWGRCCPRW